MKGYIMGALWAHYGYNPYTDIERITDIVRMYSSEVEYSEENMELLMYLT